MVEAILILLIIYCTALMNDTVAVKSNFSGAGNKMLADAVMKGGDDTKCASEETHRVSLGRSGP